MCMYERAVESTVGLLSLQQTPPLENMSRKPCKDMKVLFTVLKGLNDTGRVSHDVTCGHLMVMCDLVAAS